MLCAYIKCYYGYQLLDRYSIVKTDKPCIFNTINKTIGVVK